MLSYGGRVQLIKSVLSSIQIFWSQVFILPQKVLKAIQSACRIFLWTGKSEASKRALVSWEQLCLPKTAGGWNFISTREWNKVAMCKFLWCLAQKKDTLWVRWIHSYYIKNQSLLTMEIFGAKEYLANVPNGLSMLHAHNYSIKKVYHAMRGEFQKVSWHKMLSQNVAPPKCIFITWLAILNRLSICDKLARFGIQCDQQCIMCEKDQETHQHLFFKCDWSAHLWKELIAWSGLQGDSKGWEQENEHMISQCRSKTGKQMMYRVMFVVALYHVWKERNARRFQSKVNGVDSVVQQCKTIITFRCSNVAKLVRLLAR